MTNKVEEFKGSVRVLSKQKHGHTGNEKVSIWWPWHKHGKNMKNQISEWWQGSKRATMDQLDIRDHHTPGWRVVTWRSPAGRMIGSFDFTYLPDCQLLLSFFFLSLDGGCFAIVACLALWRIRLRYGECWLNIRRIFWMVVVQNLSWYYISMLFCS